MCRFRGWLARGVIECQQLAELFRGIGKAIHWFAFNPFGSEHGWGPHVEVERWGERQTESPREVDVALLPQQPRRLAIDLDCDSAADRRRSPDRNAPRT